MYNLPIKGWPTDVINTLKNIISDIIEMPNIVEFYIGRTDDVIATKSRHRSDDIYTLYETTSADNAIEVEDVLIKTFFDHPKCNNDINHGGGGTSDYYVNYVYIAVWHK